MKKILFVVFCFFSLMVSHAQNTEKRPFNITVDYAVGLQFFNMHWLENQNRLYYLGNTNMGVAAGGFSYTPHFKPMVLNHVGLSASIFKNKTYFFELNTEWGKNEIHTNRYSTGKQANASNPAKATSNVVYRFLSIGYGFKKQIDIGKWGSLLPGISFHAASSATSTNVSYEVRDKTTGQVVSAGDDYGRTGDYYGVNARTGFLMLFDSPKIALDYKLKLTNHIYFKASYSYWLMGAMLNNLYGLSNRYVIKFDGYDYALPSRKIGYQYSHNLSIGLSFSLRK